MENQNLEEIYYMTIKDIRHVRERHSEFRMLNDAEIFGIIKYLLQRKPPDRVKESDISIVYEYDRAKLADKIRKLSIVVSKENQGRIVTIYMRQ
jgi:hypothetical protein